MSTFEDDQLTQPNSPVPSPELVEKPRQRSLAIPVPALTWENIAWLVLLSSAFLTRFWNLAARVMSHDESEHVYFSWILSKGGGYAHNPMMHGPLLFEFTAIFDAIFKANDFTSRIVPALIGIAIVVVVPLLLRPWLGRWGAFATALLFLVSPYVLFYSRYNRHDIYEIGWVLLATFAIFSYLRAREKETAGENGNSGERWLLLLAGAEALMFSTMETAFFYLAIMTGFLVLRLLFTNGLQWKRIRHAAELDVVVVLATLGAFFSSPIALLLLNPLWTRIAGQPFIPPVDKNPFGLFNTFGIEWSSSPSGVRIWGLMIFFWWAAVVVGIFWNWRKWLKIAGLFLVITIVLFTTSFTNWKGIGTGFVGSLGYWLSQQGVARGSQPWYYYFIVFPIYEYLPLLGGVAGIIYFAFRQHRLPGYVRTFVLYLAWWAALIFVGLSAAGEKMPWLSTHITVPFILITGWFIGNLLQRAWSSGSAPVAEAAVVVTDAIETDVPENIPDEPIVAENAVAPARGGVLSRWPVALALLPFAILFVMTAHTSYLVNYVNYDSVIEFIDYAHGAPGVKWTVEDVNQIAAKLGQGNSMPVAFDSPNAWPLTWYFRDRPGFYGDQPNRGALQNDPVIIAGGGNEAKVESFLGGNYNRYDVIRIWWPMEDYKNLTWDRIRGAITDPQMRQALWNIFWSRDYRLYATLTKDTALNPPLEWPLQDRMRVYIRKDVAAQIPDLKLKPGQMADVPPPVDVYASKRITVTPAKVVQPEGLKGPRNLAFAPDGTLYVVDTDNARVVHLDDQGKVLGAWGSLTPANQTPPAQNTFNGPWGVAVDAQGNVYVADTWNHRIQKFDPSGKFLLQWGTGGLSTDGPDRFWGPRGIAVGPNGNLYITDTGNRRVVVYSPEGKFQFEFAKDGEAALNEPVGIAIDAKGRVFVADTWNSRVVIFDAQGKFLSSWPVQAWSGTSVDEKPFLAVDQAGRVYLTDPEGSRVLAFSDTGDVQAEFGQFSTGADGLNLPTGIVIGPKGDLWIADAANNRLVVDPALK